MHHQLIRDLIAEIRNLRSQLESARYDADSAYWAQEQASSKLKRSESALYEAERQAENARYDHERYAELMDKANRARQLGDDWGASRYERDARWYK